MREGFQRAAALAQRPVGQRHAVGTGQQIERDQQRGRFFRQFLDPARRRMNALEQGVEREGAVLRHHDLAIEDKRLGFQRQDGGDQLWKVARQQPA